MAVAVAGGIAVAVAAGVAVGAGGAARSASHPVPSLSPSKVCGSVPTTRTGVLLMSAQFRSSTDRCVPGATPRVYHIAN